MKTFVALLLSLSAVTPIVAMAATDGPDATFYETSIGEAKREGMQINAVFLPSVVMYPSMSGMGTNTDIHLEADVHALKDNKQGFKLDAWIPYLQVVYLIQKIEPVDNNWLDLGILLPMTANDGAHYGVNLKLDGPGKYRLTYHFNPPSYNAFLRHADMKTGVSSWWDPFDVSWEFNYTSPEKKTGSKKAEEKRDESNH